MIIRKLRSVTIMSLKGKDTSQHGKSNNTKTHCRVGTVAWSRASNNWSEICQRLKIHNILPWAPFVALGRFGLRRLGFGWLRKDRQPHRLFCGKVSGLASRWEEKIQGWPRWSWWSRWRSKRRGGCWVQCGRQSRIECLSHRFCGRKLS